jgi:hypothetical protein
MDKILKDPIAPKQKKNGIYPWSYNAPTKDQAQSGSLSAGNDYGVGFRVPVGKEMAGSYDSGPIPMESKCFSPDAIFNAEDKKG